MHGSPDPRTTRDPQADAFWYPRSRTTSRTSLQVGNSRPLRPLVLLDGAEELYLRLRIVALAGRRVHEPPTPAGVRRLRRLARPGVGRRLVAGQGDLVADGFDVVAGRMLDHGRTSGRGVSRPTPHRGASRPPLSSMIIVPDPSPYPPKSGGTSHAVVGTLELAFFCLAMPDPDESRESSEIAQYRRDDPRSAERFGLLSCPMRRARDAAGDDPAQAGEELGRIGPILGRDRLPLPSLSTCSSRSVSPTTHGPRDEAERRPWGLDSRHPCGDSEGIRPPASRSRPRGILQPRTALS